VCWINVTHLPWTETTIDKILEGQSLNWLMQSVTEAMLIADAAGRIVLVNPSLQRLFGYSGAELIGRPLEMLIPERFRRGHIGLRAGYFAQPRARSMGAGMELFGLRRSGEEFPVEVSLSPLKTDAGAALAVATIYDTTQRKLAEAALLQSRAELRQLSAHQETLKEEERKRIAQEIHDELGGLLTGIKAYVSVSVERAIRAGMEPDPLLVEAVELTATAIETVRKVITDLRPSVLDQLGVWAAIEWYLGQIAERSGLHCEVAIDPAVLGVAIDHERSTMLFRIVQETLTNVVRHAHASHATVAARREGDILIVSVTDNGKGIAQERLLNRESLGILGMYERTRHFGGELRITGTPDAGTCLVLKLPMETAHD
jgi:two-component system sensor histidine kinase UhpB